MIEAASTFSDHLPHLILVGGSMLLFFWFWSRQPPGDLTPEEREQWRAERHVRKLERRQVRPSVARRGLIGIGPLLAAVATGGVLYGIDLGNVRPGAAAIWIHVGVSMLAVVLAGYKLADVGLDALRDGLRPERILTAGASLVFSLLLVPLLITGVALVIVPGSGSFWAYSHLVTAAWWTALLLWHLKRYLIGAVVTVRSGAAAAAGPATSQRPRRRVRLPQHERRTGSPSASGSSIRRRR